MSLRSCLRPLKTVLFALCLVPSCSREQATSRASVPPPGTRASPVTETLHGTKVADNFRWLEADTAEVAAWTDAQNTYTRGVLDGLPGRRALEDRLKPLVQIGAVTAPMVRGNRYFFARRIASQDQPVVYLRQALLARRKCSSIQ
jgi:prolyl oligopeptidase